MTVEPKTFHVFKSGIASMYQIGICLIGGWTIHIYDEKGNKLVAAIFDSEHEADAWGEHIVSEKKVFPPTS